MLSPGSVMLLRWEHIEVGALAVGIGFLLAIAVLFATQQIMVGMLSRRVMRLEERLSDVGKQVSAVEQSLGHVQHQLNNVAQGMMRVNDHLIERERRGT